MKLRSLFLPVTLILAGALLLPASGEDKKKKKKKSDSEEQQPPSMAEQIQQELQRRMGVQPTQKVPAVQAQPVKVRVANYTGRPVELVWLNPNGAQQSYGELPPLDPGAEVPVMQTYSGHQWLFRVNGRVIQAFTATNKRDQSLVLGQPRNANTNTNVTIIPPSEPVRRPHRTDPVAPVDNSPANFPPPSGGNSAPAVAQEFLRVHNDARARVGVAPLRWSNELARYAQQWADQLAASGQFKHRPPGSGYGENLFGGSVGYGPADAARHWLEEKSAYNGGPVTPQNFNAVGHYTQMVWSGTTEVGYGMATGRNGVVVVANYAPAGNRSGQKPY